MAPINRNSTIPLYHQVRQALLDEIQEGVYGDGDLLPSEKELERIYGVSRITVRRALSDLSNAGYITRQPGRGTFALSTKIHHRSGKIGGFLDDLAAQDFRVSSEMLEYREQAPPTHVARELGVSTKKSLLYTKQVIFANNEPVAMGYTYHNHPDPITLSQEELSTDSVVNLLRQKYGLTLRHARRTTQLAHVTEEEAQILNIAPQDAVIQAELIAFDESSRALFHIRSLYCGDRYIYRETIQL